MLNLRPKRTMKFLKFLLTAAALAVLLKAPAAHAQNLTTVQAVSATTPLTVLTGGKYIVSEIRFINSSASSNAATVKFYDSASNDTNYVVQAATAYSTITTNYSTTFTNSSGIVVTNTFSGTYTLGTAVSASTNERPNLLGPFLVPYAPTSPTIIGSIAVAPYAGLTVYSTQAGTIQVTYRQVTP